MKSLQQLTRRKALTGLATPRLASQNLASHRLWQRNFGVTASAASQLAALDASKLSITKTTTPKELTPPKDLVFGKTFTGRALYFNAIHVRSLIESRFRSYAHRRVDRC